MSILSSLLAALQAHTPRGKWSRRSQRFAVSASARLRLSNSAGSAWERVTLDNLSLGGARVRTTVPLAANSKTELWVALDGAREIELRARVVYAVKADGNQTKCGLRFVDLPYERYKDLIAYITDREKANTIGVAHPREIRPA